ncbi:MAG: hypothetical protein HOW73_13995 [Polyangiaceae bacterium]|nr:hypothetical protein [Polyangiaceae bacterium]
MLSGSFAWGRGATILLPLLIAGCFLDAVGEDPGGGSSSGGQPANGGGGAQATSTGGMGGGTSDGGDATGAGTQGGGGSTSSSGGSGGEGGQGPTCGDGIVDQGEACDAGPAGSTGCVACAEVKPWKCSGAPSVCSATFVSPVGGTGGLITEEGYTGAFSSMDAYGVTIAQPPANSRLTKITSTVAIDHSNGCDLVIKVAPTNGPPTTYATLVSRAGINEQSDDDGEGAPCFDLGSTHVIVFDDSAPTSSEDMDNGVNSTQTVCGAAPECSFQSSPGSTTGVTLTTLKETLAAQGISETNWTFYIKDANNWGGGPDFGTLVSANVALSYQSPP